MSGKPISAELMVEYREAISCSKGGYKTRGKLNQGEESSNICVKFDRITKDTAAALIPELAEAAVAAVTPAPYERGLGCAAAAALPNAALCSEAASAWFRLARTPVARERPSMWS